MTNPNDQSKFESVYGVTNTGSLTHLLQGILGKDYTVSYHDRVTGENVEGESRAYARVGVSHRGGREMILDVRYLESEPGVVVESAVKGAPAIAVRQRGAVGLASEAVFGGKAYRPSRLSPGYVVASPLEAVADIIKGAHRYYETVPYASTGGRTPVDAFTAVYSSVLSGRAGKVIGEIVREFNIAPPSGLNWGSQRPGFIDRIATQLGISWGPDKRYKEEELLRQSAPNLGTSAPAYYDPVHKTIQIERQYRIEDDPSGIPTKKVFRHRGGREKTDEQLALIGLKETKQEASIREAREEAFPVSRVMDPRTGKMVWKRLSPPTPDDIYTAETFGQTLGEEATWVSLGRKRERLTGLSLITQTPSGAGAGYASETAVPRTDLEGNELGTAYRMSSNVPLPWETSSEWKRAVSQLEKWNKEHPEDKRRLIDLGQAVGSTSRAMARQGPKLGRVTYFEEVEEKDEATGVLKKVMRPGSRGVYADARAYGTQVDTATVVIPSYVNISTGEFSGVIPTGLTGQARDNWVPTTALEKQLYKMLGGKKSGITIERSGSNKMYLSVGGLGFVDPGYKLGGVKESNLPTGLPDYAWSFRDTLIKASSITQEVKSGGDLWVGAFEVQPYENKLRMLEMVDPRLRDIIQKRVDTGSLSREKITPKMIASVYSGIRGKGSDFYAPEEVISKAIDKILSETDPTLRASNYKRFGIFSFREKETMDTETLTEEGVIAFKQRYMQMNGMKDEKEFERTGIRFIPFTSGQNILYRLKSPIPKNSYILPKAVGIATEWPMAGGLLPTQALSKFNQAYPEIAKMIGMQTGVGFLKTGDPTQAAKAWVALVKSDKYRQESQSGHTLISQDTLIIDKDKATQIMKELGISRDDLSKPIKEVQIKQLQKILSDKGGGKSPDMIYFKGTQSYMPTSDVALYLDKFNKATGAASTGVSQRYLTAIFDLLESERLGNADPGTGYRRWVSYQANQISKSSKANQIFSKLQSGRVKMSNYNVLDFLAPNEAAMSDEQLEAFANSQPGLHSPQDVARFVAYVKKTGYLPAFGIRIPTIGNVHAMKILTNETLKAKYGDEFDLNKDISSNKGTMFINRWMHETGIGDRDIDKMMIWSGLLIDKVKGKINISNIIERSPEWIKSMKKTGREYMDDLTNELGGNTELINSYSHISSYYKDYEEARKGGFKPFMEKSGDYGWVKSSVLNDVSRMYSEIRARRGTSYNVVRAIEESAQAVGISGKLLQDALGPYGVKLVQSSLETKAGSSERSPLEGVVFSEKVGDSGAVISMGLADVKSKFSWEKVAGFDISTPRQEIMIANLLAEYSKADVNNDMLGVLFGTDTKTAMKISELAKGKQGMDRFYAILNDKKVRAQIMKNPSAASLIVNYALARTTMNSQNIPVNLKEELDFGLDFMKTSAGRAIALLDALRTGKNFRAFGFDDIKEAIKIVNPESEEGKRLVSFASDMGFFSAREIEFDKEWRGISREKLQNLFKGGMTSMRASDFSYLAAGIESGAIKELRKHPILYQKVLGMTSEWISDMYLSEEDPAKKGMKDIFEFSSGAKAAMRKGEVWEADLAKQAAGTLGINTGSMRTIRAKVFGTEVRFRSDFINVKDGTFYTTEAKHGATDTRMAGFWQSAINKYGYLAAYKDSPTELRKTLEEYVEGYNKSRASDPTYPELDKDFVDQAMDAIGKGRVVSQFLHRDPKTLETELFKVTTSAVETEKMMGAVKGYLQLRGTETVKELAELAKGKAFRALDRYSSILKTKASFRLPMGIGESFLRLTTGVRLKSTQGLSKKELEEAMKAGFTSDQANEYLNRALGGEDPAKIVADISETTGKQLPDSIMTKIFSIASPARTTSEKLPTPKDIRIVEQRTGAERVYEDGDKLVGLTPEMQEITSLFNNFAEVLRGNPEAAKVAGNLREGTRDYLPRTGPEAARWMNIRYQGMEAAKALMPKIEEQAAALVTGFGASTKVKSVMKEHGALRALGYWASQKNKAGFTSAWESDEGKALRQLINQAQNAPGVGAVQYESLARDVATVSTRFSGDIPADRAVRLGMGTEETVGAQKSVREMISLGKTLEDLGITSKKGKRGGGGVAKAADEPMDSAIAKERADWATSFTAQLEKIEIQAGKSTGALAKASEVWTDFNHIVTGSKLIDPQLIKNMRALQDTLSAAGKLSYTDEQGVTKVPGTPMELLKAGAQAVPGMLTGPSATAETRVAAGKIESQMMQYAKKLAATEVGEQNIIESKATDVGHLARRALGGFGLMYLRTMAGIMGTGFSTGTDQAVALRQQYIESAAQASGIGARYIGQEQSNVLMQGLYGIPTNPLAATLGRAMTQPIGRELLGAGSMGLGAYAVTQQFVDWLGGVDSEKGGKLNKAAPWIAGGAVAIGGIADIINQAGDPKSLAFRIASQEAGKSFSLTAPLAEAYALLTNRQEYLQERELARAANIFTGLTNPESFAASGRTRARGYAPGISPDMTATEAMRTLYPGASMAELLVKGTPALAASYTRIHPETASVAAEVSAFMIENKIKGPDYAKLATQWQYGIASKQVLGQIAGIFGTNLAGMEGKWGQEMMSLASMQVTGQQREALGQGMQFGQNLGFYGATLGLTNANQWVPQLQQWSQYANTYAGQVYSQGANAYMATLATVGQIPQPWIPSGVPVTFQGNGRPLTYRELTPAEAKPWEWANLANEQMSMQYETEKQIFPGFVAPQYYDEKNAPLGITEEQLAFSNRRVQDWRSSTGVRGQQIRARLASMGYATADIDRVMEGMRPTLGGAGGAAEVQYNAALTQYRESMARGGLQAGAQYMSIAEGGTLGVIQQRATQATQAAQWVQQAEARGLQGGALESWRQWGQLASQAPPAQFGFMNQLMNLNPIALAAMAAGTGPQGFPQEAARAVYAASGQGYGGMQSGNLFGLTGTNFVSPSAPGYMGAPNGLPWGLTSGALGGLSAMQVATNVWGGQFVNGQWQQAGIGGWGTLTGAPAGRSGGPPPAAPGGWGSTGIGYNAAMINAFAGTQPFITPNGQELVGIYGMKAVAAQNSYNMQMAGIGNAMQQWQATQAFTTGVGLQKYANTVNPVTGTPFGFNTGQFSFNVPGVGGYTSQSGGFWGVQEAQMNLGYLQQEQQFAAQQQLMGIQRGQFYQNMGLNMRGAQMQRGWTQQDWGYQSQVRGLQWGWRQEDFAEQSRFMTGRDRRLAERQMGRESTMHNLEEDQIQKTRDRQKELWKMEDERFELQRTQFEENRQYQIEQMNIARDFFEARKKLEEESMLLQRAYWVVQQELQKKALGIQAAAAAQALKDQITFLELAQAQDEAGAALNIFTEEGLNAMRDIIVDRVNPALSSFIVKLGQVADAANELGGGDEPPEDPNEGKPGYAFCSKCGKWMKIGHSHLEAAGINEWVFGETNFTAGEGALPEKVTIQPLGQGTYRSPWQDEVLVPAQEMRSSTPKTIVIPVYIGDRLLKEIIVETMDDEVRIH